MAYNLRSRLPSTSAPEGSGVAQESEGLGLSPVEFAVPMSEPTTAGRGPDLPGLPVIIESSPEAFQTAATSVPIASQIVTGTGETWDTESDDGQTGIPDSMVVHPASSVCSAGAAGLATVSYREPVSTLGEPSAYSRFIPSLFRDSPAADGGDPVSAYRDTVATWRDPSLLPITVFKVVVQIIFVLRYFMVKKNFVMFTDRFGKSTLIRTEFLGSFIVFSKAIYLTYFTVFEQSFSDMTVHLNCL